jgi:F-type H+-transporting ATPase subunit b
LERDVEALLDQLGLDKTFFIELGILAVFFTLLSNLYFKPFLKLFEARRKKTVGDREAAERLLAQANTKWDEYNRRLTEERQAARKTFESALNEAKKQEAQILGQAREEAKKITQEAADSVNRQREQLKRELEVDVESIAHSITERLLARKM